MQIKNSLQSLLALCTLSLLLCACQSIEEQELQSALKQAGENRSELEKVLIHYSAEEDTLKYKAALFLIRNMQYHYSEVSPEWTNYYAKFDSINSLTPTRWSVSRQQDSLYKLLKRPNNIDVSRVYDTQLISSSQLIRHIDERFAVYDSAMWCRDVPFESFCEYLLPYRVDKEELDFDWPIFYQEKVKKRAHKAFHYAKSQSDSLYIILDRMRTDYRIDIEYNGKYIHGYKPQQLASMKRGTCTDYTLLSCFMFRSVGIPMSLDYTPLWGNRSMGHNWNALLINSAVIDTTCALDYSFSAAPKPLGQYLSSNPNLPTKVYRTTFSRQKESLAVIHGDEEIPNEFESMFLKDVSADYGLRNVVSIKIPEEFQNHKFYYLCSFDNQNWMPIAWTKREKDRITFLNVGGDIVYLPCLYEHHKMNPVSDPLILHKGGKVEFLHIDQLHNQRLILDRKYSFNKNTERWSHLFEGARIEVADNVHFLHPKVIYLFPDSMAINFQHIKLKQPCICQYIRFVPRGDKEGGEVADFQLFDQEAKPITGLCIGSKNWDSRHPLDAAFDNDVLTFAQAKNDSSAWLGMNLGRRRLVSEIRILPHNDDNFIRKGENYQLQCWDQGQWWIIDEQIGDDSQHLQFNMCPCNALFRLRDLTKGKEERIFTYENGKQVWW